MQTLSVIIPVHNRHDYFLKCLDSVLRQKKKKIDFQIIVVDEASKPTINQLLIEKKIKVPNLTIIRNKRPIGPSLARSQGIRHATGNMIAFLDSDDFWRSNFVQDALKDIRSGKSEVVTGYPWPVFSADISWFSRFYFTLLSISRIVCLFLHYYLHSKRLSYEFFYMLRLSNCIFTKKAIGSVKFVMSYRTAEDWKFFWDCIRLNSPIIRILPQVVVDVTYHKNAETIRRSNYWGYYYKLINEFPLRFRNSLGIKAFKLHTDLSVVRSRFGSYA